jgi:hypothetical protein
MVFHVVDFHRLGVDVGDERVVGAGQFREFVCHVFDCFRVWVKVSRSFPHEAVYETYDRLQLGHSQSVFSLGRIIIGKRGIFYRAMANGM